MISLLALFLAACGGEGKQAEAGEEKFDAAQVEAQAKAYEEMMDAHDRVMPKMGQIAQLQKALITKMETEKMTDETKVMLKEPYNMLEMAYDGMMGWMKEIQPMDSLRVKMGHEEILKYLEGQKQSMTKIEAYTEKGLMVAKEVLGDAVEMKADDHSGHDHGDHEGHEH